MRLINKSLFPLLFIILLSENAMAQEYSILNLSFEENQIVVSDASNIFLIANTGRTITGTIESHDFILSSNVLGFGLSIGNRLSDLSEEKSVSLKYSLSQNYPNPFNPSTKIKFSVAKASNVNITVYNMLGERVTVLVDRILNPGEHEVTWNANNYSNGVYLCVMRSGEFMDSKKVILLK